MDYIPPTNSIDIDGDEIELSDVGFHRDPWMVLYSLLFLSILFLGAELVHRASEGTNIQQIDIPVLVANHSDDHFLPQEDIVKSVVRESRFLEGAKIDSLKPITVIIKQTDSLGKIFKKFGLSTKAAIEIAAIKQAKILKGMLPGRKLSLALDSNANLKELTYEINPMDTLVVTPSDKGWSVRTDHVKPIVKTRYASSKVNSSIYVSAKNAGIPLGLVTQFMRLMENQINVRRISGDDRFALFYNDFSTPDGKRAKSSELMAAEIIHGGKVYRIVRFTDPDGHVDFYTPDGYSLKPSFTRYPLQFRRVASRFSLNRRHPILNIVRPHSGVDFSASMGTPVKATSKGMISFAARQGGYGRVVKLKNGKYTTVYAHLSRFANGITVGKYVNQGDIIGYVGSSGLSTSPHLHYEVRINGKPYDPLTVKLPEGQMIAPKYRGNFFASSKKLLAKLDLYSKNHKVLAMGNKPDVN